MSIEFKYTDKTTEETSIFFNGHEMEIRGDFGMFTFNYNDQGGSICFKAYKMHLRIGQEHTIGGNKREKFIGELLVYHKSKAGEKAIISFMLKTYEEFDPTKVFTPNPFFS